MLKVLELTCGKFWCLSACKKSTSSLTSFLRYCRHCKLAIGNFGNAWLSPSKVIVSICRELSCLDACNKSTSSLTFFLRYCKKIANLLFWVIWACLVTPIMIVSIWTNLWCLSASKKQLLSFHFPWDIAKILQIYYSGYFGQACLHSPKMILAPKIILIVHFFLKILHFKESCSSIGQQYFGP